MPGYGSRLEKCRKVAYGASLNFRNFMAAANKKLPAIDTLSFEDAMRELEAIVRSMETGQVELERAMQDYTRGAELRAHCAKKLAEAKMKVEHITQGADGSLSVTPFEVE
jgi:exodeoxyribonuclease VII small subunit